MLPIAATLLKLKTNIFSVYSLYLFSGLIGYLFLGAYLFEAVKPAVRPLRWFVGNLLAFILCSVGTMAATYLYSIHVGSPNELFY